MNSKRSWKTPTPEQVESAIALIAVPAQRWSFFAKLENPNWIAPLRDRGFFAVPPAPIVDRVEGTVSYPAWPASSYLARVGRELPEVAIETALGVPDTENTRVIADLSELASSLPPDMAISLVPRVIAGLDAGGFVDVLVDPACRLVEHLAGAGEVDAAIELTAAVLSFDVVEDGEEEDFRGPGHGRVRTLLSRWQYGRAVAAVQPSLSDAAPMRTLEFLVDHLERLVRNERLSRAPEAFDDFSYIWRPSIEPHAQNRGHEDPDDALVLGVVASGMALARNSIEDALAAIAHFEAKHLLIMDRIALVLAREAALALGEDAVPIVVDRLPRESFDDERVRREYFALAASTLPLLPPDTRTTLLSWVDSGPDVADYRRRVEQVEGRPPTDSEVADYGDHWRLTRLALLGDELPELQAAQRRALTERLGEPEHPDFISYSGSWIGPTSPLKVDDLADLDIAGVVAALRGWQPPGGPLEPSREGLGRQLTEDVKARPTAYAAAAQLFETVDPTYVRAVLHGLRMAAREGEPFGLDEVLALAQWVVLQPREDFRQSDMDSDPGWGWSRAEIARLISEVLNRWGASVPAEHAAGLLSVLSVLVEDPDPSPEDEERYGGGNMGPGTYAINCVRGVAVEALFAVLRWYHVTATSEGRVPPILADLPEIRALLERRLDLGVEESAAVRSQFGRHTGLLLAVDPDWYREHLAEILPSEPELNVIRDAVWSSFVVFNRPSGRALEVLGGVYLEEVAVARPDEKKASLGHPEGHAFELAEHVISYFWWGDIGLESADGLMAALFGSAAPAVAAHAMEFIGRSLHDEGSPVDAEVEGRLVALLAARLDQIPRDEAPSERAGELAAYGWWFSAGRLNRQWALDTLLVILERGILVDWVHEVVEQLAVYLPTRPLDTLRALRLMTQLAAAASPFELYGLREGAQSLLTAAFQIPDPEVEVAARRVVDLFLRQGFGEFRDLRPTR